MVIQLAAHKLKCQDKYTMLIKIIIEEDSLATKEDHHQNLQFRLLPHCQ